MASKSGSMDACRNDGGIVHTPYGEYVIVLMNKNFDDIIEYNAHPAMVYGARVSRMILDQILACEGRFVADRRRGLTGGLEGRNVWNLLRSAGR